MVLLAAAVCTKPGKALVSRQFVEMTRARIEGLLAAFPKLLGSEKTGQRQHTFVETESVRYVYQPMDQLYVLLITTKASNILEDLETLRLFSRVIPEYCRSMEEKEILEQAFQLIFAFDEIVALGYRENVNLAQIRTFTEMDSHEERVFYQIKKTQEEEAKKLARDKAKELARQKQDIAKGRGRTPGHFGSGMGSQDKYEPTPVTVDTLPEKPKPYSAPSRPSGPNRALKLGSKKVDEDQFINQLKSEGQDIVAAPARQTKTAAGNIAPPAAVSGIKMEKVHIRTEEKINLTMTRDGGLENMEIHGIMLMRIADDQLVTVKLQLDNKDTKGAQIQTHPNLDKKAWQSSSILQLKSANKPFPINNDVGVLKWRFQTTDEEQVPLTINCWPSESGQGCDVNIEYTLESDDLDLQDVLIVIPLPSGVSPVIGECDGDYKYDRAKQQLQWRLQIVDQSNKTGTLEFTTSTGHADNFFPIRVSFVSKQLMCNIKPVKISRMTDDGAVNFSQESALFVDKYEIV